RLPPSRPGWTSAGVQRVFHRPPSRARSAVVSYTHDVGTPGNVQVYRKVAVAEEFWALRDATPTSGCTGPIPATSAWKAVFTSALVALANSTRLRSAWASPSASCEAARSGLSSVGVGVGAVLSVQPARK